MEGVPAGEPAVCCVGEWLADVEARGMKPLMPVLVSLLGVIAPAAAGASAAATSSTVNLACMSMVEVNEASVKSLKAGQNYAFNVEFEIGDRASSDFDLPFKAMMVNWVQLKGYLEKFLKEQSLTGEAVFHSKQGLFEVNFKAKETEDSDLRIHMYTGIKGRALFELFRVREGGVGREDLLYASCQSNRDFRDVQIPGNTTI
jgi:hypothetical protein